MLKLQIYTVYDIRLGGYMEPFCIATEEMAKRAFCNSCKDPNHPFGQNPADYALNHVGTWDAQKGKIVAMDNPFSIMNGTEALHVTETSIKKVDDE
jgi:hypothetical protein